MTRLGYPLNRLKPPEVNYLPFQSHESDTSVVGLCFLCYAAFPIFRFGLKLFYLRYSKKVMSRENSAVGFPTRSEANYLNKKNKGAI